MQAFARRLDPTRRTTVAISGGWGGSSTVIDVAGYNYIHQSNTDRQHAQFPNQPGVGTEESTTRQTRGIYSDNRAKGHLAPLEDASSGGNCEVGWKHYAARPYLAGLFYWTGFDHRGEPNPIGWPQVDSQCGILDLCGFPKDSFYYVRSCWTSEPLVHIYPHWNWPGKEGQDITVRSYSNCEEIELMLNGRSLGRKAMEKNSHLDWNVKYEPGTLLARGYRNGREAAADRVETVGEPAAIRLIPDRARIKADREDVSVVTVQIVDAAGRIGPAADNRILFSLEGPGRIIGVGNGDPASHERDCFTESAVLLAVRNWRSHTVESGEHPPEAALEYDHSAWPPAFQGRRSRDVAAKAGSATMYRAGFELPEIAGGQNVMLLLDRLGEQQSVFLNGEALPTNARGGGADFVYEIAVDRLRQGRNVLAIVVAGTQGVRREDEERLRSTGAAIVRIQTPAGQWQRSTFNGLAQVLVQSTGQAGFITLTASSPGLSTAALKLGAEPAWLRPAIAAQ
jgi:beta-galactosidase